MSQEIPAVAETTLPDGAVAASTEKTDIATNQVSAPKAPPASKSTESVAGKPDAESHPVPEVAREKPFSVDVLSTCTARFDRQGWDLFLRYRDDLTAIQSKRIKVQLHARTETGAQEIRQILEANDVPAVKQTGVDLSVITTFAGLQLVIRHPQTLMATVRLAQAA